MEAGGLRGDEQLLADLPVGPTFGDQRQHLGLTVCEAERGGRGGRLRRRGCVDRFLGRRRPRWASRSISRCRGPAPTLTAVWWMGWGAASARERAAPLASSALIATRWPATPAEHVGSTAVPGLAGKNIIDLLLAAPAGPHPRPSPRPCLSSSFRNQHPAAFPATRPMLWGAFRHGATEYPVHVHVVPAVSPEVAALRASGTPCGPTRSFAAATLP
jgi:hypothetical protein